MGSPPELYNLYMANYHTLMCIGEVARLYVNARDIDKDDSWNDVYDPVYLKWNKLSGSATLDGYVEGLIPAGGASMAAYNFNYTRWKMPISVGTNGEGNSLEIEYYNHDDDPYEDEQLIIHPIPPGGWTLSNIFKSQIFGTTASKPTYVKKNIVEWYDEEDPPSGFIGRTLIVPYNMQLGERMIEDLWRDVALSINLTVHLNYLIEPPDLPQGNIYFECLYEGRSLNYISWYTEGPFDEDCLVAVGVNGLTQQYKDEILSGVSPFHVIKQVLSVDGKQLRTRYLKFHVDKETRFYEPRDDFTWLYRYYNYHIYVDDTP